jgi:preprotein translocase subunit SecG
MLAYFGTPRQASTSSVLEGAAVSAPVPVETGPASQIPGNAPAASGAPASPAAPAK